MWLIARGAMADVAGGPAAPEHAPALRGVGRGGELLHPLHREGKGHVLVGHGHRQALEQLEQARDTVDSPEASGDAIAEEFERYLQRRDGKDGRGSAGDDPWRPPSV